METWWERLKRRVDELGWSHTELARRSGLDRSAVQKYLEGKVENPRGDAMERLARAIDRPISWLRLGIPLEAVALSPEERQLVEWLRDLPEDDQEDVLNIARKLHQAALTRKENAA